MKPIFPTSPRYRLRSRVFAGEALSGNQMRTRSNLLPAERRGGDFRSSLPCESAARHGHRSSGRALQAGRLEVEMGFREWGGLAFSRSSLTRCCLTIASEGRETWAAGSLRGFGVGLGFWRELEAWSGGGVREETTDGHVSRIHRALRGLRWNAVRRAGAGLSLRRMCLELVKNTMGSRGPVEVTSRD